MRMVVMMVVAAVTLASGASATAHNVDVEVNVTAGAAVLPPLFLSVTIDGGFATLNYSDPQLQKLTKALSPGYIRFGGNSHQRMNYSFPQQGSGDFATGADATTTLTPEAWNAIYAFAGATNMEVVFGLNGLTLFKNMSWNEEPAFPFLNYVADHKQFVGWELGNEPDLYSKRNITVTPGQRGNDFYRLRGILNNLFPITWLMGPDIADSGPKGQAYMATFLKHVPVGMLDGATWHQYYGSGASAKLWMASDPLVLDKFVDEATAYSHVLRTSQHRDIWMWLGETSNFYDGGSKSVSPTYAAGFMWLDKLGVAARLNTSIVCRQTLVGGVYSLIEHDTLTPHIDYWLSVLHKRLFGPTVLAVDGGLARARTVRVYAHCTPAAHTFAGKGAVSLMVLNTDNTTAAALRFDNKKLASSRIGVYDIQPSNARASDTTATLNGNPLQLTAAGDLPELQPKRVAPGTPITVQPTRYMMLVFVDAHVPACLS
ncbi:hypothetical protein PTSG_00821 [Salpingoeca rosetta]|uniref:Heparanase n=1 Tax=Salpingoeca rosetta (strain ATCC 50818 / BSB-021) TaxID=946362 RepID=F2TXK5_SALR5|nr:uncharacterized protein PTSG_00821 [Salpingoeca rosetta]EGD76114.1 hypothetical protein PTSG_00821 [Salpingoeca rosetta]|eukprot:XP_004998289.1 hypothetical protein PTSG_00821 [Salpingoeca rosetta]